VGVLGFGAKLSKIEILSSGTWPVACEYAWVSTCGLSIKLDG